MVVQEAMSERKMVFDKLVPFGQSHDLPVTAHQCVSQAIVPAPQRRPKRTAEEEACGQKVGLESFLSSTS